MKKLLLSLGTVAAIAAPVASVIACGSTDSALSNLKKLDIATVKKSKLSDADKKADIAKINAAKDVKSLTALMTKLAPQLGASATTKLLSWTEKDGKYQQVNSGYSVEVTRPDKKVFNYYVKAWTLAELKNAFEDATFNTNSFKNLFEHYKMGDAKPVKSAADFIKLFATPQTFDVLTDLHSNTDKNTYKITPVKKGVSYIPTWAPTVQLYLADKTPPATN